MRIYEAEIQLLLKTRKHIAKSLFLYEYHYEVASLLRKDLANNSNWLYYLGATQDEIDAASTVKEATENGQP